MSKIDLLMSYKRSLQIIQDEINLINADMEYLAIRKERSIERLQEIARKICEIEGHRLSADKTLTVKDGMVRKCVRCGAIVPVNKTKKEDIITNEKVFKKTPKVK